MVTLMLMLMLMLTLMLMVMPMRLRLIFAGCGENLMGGGGREGFEFIFDRFDSVLGFACGK